MSSVTADRSPIDSTQAARTKARPRSIRRSLMFWLGAGSSVLLGLVLLVSTYTKAVDPQGFVVSIQRGGLLDFLGETLAASLAAPAAYFMIALEAGLCLALLLVIRRPSIYFVASVLMIAFLGLAIYHFYYPPADAGCGCFGNFASQTPGQKVFQNAVFALLALLSWLTLARGLTTGWLRALPVIAFVGVLGFALAAPSLPIDGWPGVTKLNTGAEVAALKINDVVPELETGTHVVAVIDRAQWLESLEEEDEQVLSAILRLNELALAGDVQVYALAEDDEDLEGEFYWTAAPAFDVRGAPYSLLKPLYRGLPRTFVTVDGVVTHVWNTVPDTDAIKEVLSAPTGQSSH